MLIILNNGLILDTPSCDGSFFLGTKVGRGPPSGGTCCLPPGQGGGDRWVFGKAVACMSRQNFVSFPRGGIFWLGILARRKFKRPTPFNRPQPSVQHGHQKPSAYGFSR